MTRVSTSQSASPPVVPPVDGVAPAAAPAAAPFRLAPLMFAALVGTMAMMAYVAVIGPVVRQLHLPEWVAGLSVTVGGIFWMLLARWWGRVSDRRGRKPVLLMGLGVFALVYVVLAIGVDLSLQGYLGAMGVAALLVATRTLIGAFYAAVPPTAAATIADHTVPQARGPAMARLGTANALGMVAGPAAAGWLATYSLSAAFYVAAVLPLLGFVVIAFMLPARQAPTGAAAGRPAAKSLALFDVRLRTICLTAFTAMFSVAVAQVLVGFFAIDRLGLDNEAGARVAGWSLTAVGGALIVSQQFVMRLKSVPPSQWIWMGALISGAGFASVLLTGSALSLLCSYGVAAFGMGMIFPTFQAMAANAVEADEQGAAAGTVGAAQGLGMVVGPLGGTLLYRLQPELPYLLVGCMLVALGLLTLSRRARIVKP